MMQTPIPEQVKQKRRGTLHFVSIKDSFQIKIKDVKFLLH